jgi:NAD(P)-dependent dehydrogenase (short-subunit alcohol dehydrogenase family)
MPNFRAPTAPTVYHLASTEEYDIILFSMITDHGVDDMSTGETHSGRLQGRKILITGGASGIGLATLELFVREGARVAVLDVDRVTLDRTVKQGAVHVAEANVTDETAVNAAVSAAAHAMDGLDGLVNAAGISITRGLAEQDLASWRKVLDVNLTGAFLVTKAALPHLQAASHATIVNVSSGIALRPFTGLGAYAASKAGLLAWTKVLAQELGPRIRVNATCPGATDTPLMRANMPPNVEPAQFASQYVMRRQGEALEQAHAILFLTGPESTFITGVSLAIDGGRTFH